MNMKTWNILSLTLIIVGAINWGLIGFFKFDFISLILGGQTSLPARIVYAVVGLCGLYAITFYSSLSDNQTPTYGRTTGHHS
jgi:hypothetical protein